MCLPRCRWLKMVTALECYRMSSVWTDGPGFPPARGCPLFEPHRFEKGQVRGLSYSVWAAITRYDRPSGLSSIYFLEFWRLEVKIKGQPIWLLACRWPPSHCVLTGQSASSLVSPYKDTNPIVRTPPQPHLNLVTAPKPHLQIRPRG